MIADYALAMLPDALIIGSPIISLIRAHFIARTAYAWRECQEEAFTRAPGA